MNAPETALAAPVKGTTFTLPNLARFLDWNRQPRSLSVTSVKGDVVYFCDSLYRGERRKMSVAYFHAHAADVVVPEDKMADRGPKMSVEECQALHQRAHAAGLAAGEAARPEPMVVVQRANPFDDTSRIVKEYAPVMDGVCGFAYVTVRPGTSSYARFLKRHFGGFKAYYGGVQFSVRAFGQSLERKSAYAYAYAQVLSDAGINASVETRMD